MRSDVVFDSLYLDRCLRSSWHLDIVMLLLLGVASLMCRSDSVVFGLPGSWVWQWLIWCHLIFDLSYLWYHTGAYPISFGGLWILTDSHDHHHLRDAHWDVDVIVTWQSLSRPIQLGLHFLTLGCHHASPSGRYILDLCAWFSYGFGWLVLHVRRQMISCRSISDLSCTWCHTGVYFRFGWDLRIFTEVTYATIDDFMSFCSSDLSCTWLSYWGIFSILDEIYGSSLMSHVRW